MVRIQGMVDIVQEPHDIEGRVDNGTVLKVRLVAVMCRRFARDPARV